MADDDFNPWVQGDTLMPLIVQFDTRNGELPITGNALSLVMTNGATRHVGTGTWNITDGAAGHATYTFSDADVATPGTWSLQASRTVAGKVQHTDTRLMQIVAPL
jgi:hypothetical protein